MIPIQTIIVDMDDTLLMNDRSVSPLTKTVLEKCQKRGIRIILCSGRPAASLRSYVKLLKIDSPYICCNGAQTLDGKTDDIIVDLQFQREEALECIDFFEEKGMYAQYYDGDFFCYNKKGKEAYKYAEITRMNGRYVGQLSKAYCGRTPKVLGIDSHERVLAAYYDANHRFGNNISVTMSKPFFLEMTPAEATKGNALARLESIIGINPQSSMAFGDSYNDLSMLKWARYGVAVANACNEIKAAVSMHCLANEEQGVAKFICENVLNEKFDF